MTPAEAVTRPDAWRVNGSYRNWWVLRRLLDGGIEFHRGRPRGDRSRGAVITFRYRDHAEARAGALNLADAEASNREEQQGGDRHRGD